MRIVLAMTLSVGVVVLWQALGGLRVSAQVGDPDELSTQNGDVNGDGKLDIGDAVYIINFRLVSLRRKRLAAKRARAGA